MIAVVLTMFVVSMPPADAQVADDAPVRLSASDGVDGDLFGAALAVNEDGTVVVGAPAADDVGAVYVFTPNGDGFTQQKLTAADSAAGDAFGSDVAINDSGVIVVGVPGADDRGGQSGSASVFSPGGVGGYLETKLLGSNVGARSRFGSQVAVSADGMVWIGGNQSLHGFALDDAGGYEEVAYFDHADLVGDIVSLEVRSDGTVAFAPLAISNPYQNGAGYGVVRQDPAGSYRLETSPTGAGSAQAVAYSPLGELAVATVWSTVSSPIFHNVILPDRDVDGNYGYDYDFNAGPETVDGLVYDGQSIYVATGNRLRVHDTVGYNAPVSFLSSRDLGLAASVGFGGAIVLPGDGTLLFESSRSDGGGEVFIVDLPPIDPTGTRTVFNGPHTVPGVVEAEDFDAGGQGVSYSDSDDAQGSSSYRAGEAVDVFDAPDGAARVVGRTRVDEWVSYTVSSPQSQRLDIVARAASGEARAGSIRVFVGGSGSGQASVPGTEGWWSFEEVDLGTYVFPEGESVVSLRWAGTTKVNLDRLEFRPSNDELECEATAGLVTWTDIAQDAYSVYRSIDSGSSYSLLGATTGSPAPASFTDPVPAIGARYQIEYPGDGGQRADCKIASEPRFDCSVDDGVVSWTDLVREKYWIYRSTDDGLTYQWLGRTIGSPASSTFTDPSPVIRGKYQLRWPGPAGGEYECRTITEPGGVKPPRNDRVVVVPGIVEAEGPDGDGDGYVTSQNFRSAYYRVWVGEADSYTFSFSHSSAVAGSTATLIVDDQVISESVQLRGTGDWSNYVDTVIASLELSAGGHDIQITWGPGEVRLDSFTVGRTADAPPVVEGSISCVVTRGFVAWGDVGAIDYQVYKSTDDGASYELTFTTATTMFADPVVAPGTRYQVAYPGVDRTDCTTIEEPTFASLRLVSPDAAPGDGFGRSVAINASGVIVVGAPRSGPNFEGAVYVFTPDGSGGYEHQQLVLPEAARFAGFGSSVEVNNAGVILAGGFAFIPDGEGGYTASELGVEGALVMNDTGTIWAADFDYSYSTFELDSDGRVGEITSFTVEDPDITEWYLPVAVRADGTLAQVGRHLANGIDYLVPDGSGGYVWEEAHRWQPGPISYRPKVVAFPPGADGPPAIVTERNASSGSRDYELRVGDTLLDLPFYSSAGQSSFSRVLSYNGQTVATVGEVNVAGGGVQRVILVADMSADDPAWVAASEPAPTLAERSGNNWFGEDLALAPDGTMVVGAPRDGSVYPGEVFIFSLDGNDSPAPPLPPPVPPSAFACSVGAGAVSWTDAGQSKYWVYKSTDGGLTYQWLGRTLGATSFADPVPMAGALYQVHYAGIPRVGCTVTDEPGVVPGVLSLPGVIEAEEYTRAVDTEPGNQGAATQFAGDVDVWPKPSGAGFVVGRIRDGESTSYRVSVATSGSYQFAVSTASGASGGTVTVRVDGVKVGQTTALDATGGWWNYTATDIGEVDIAAGPHVITVQWGAGQSNFDSIIVTQN